MTAATQQQIQMAAQLYQAREAARTILGPKFAPTMKDLGQSLQSIAEATNGNVLSAAIKVARSVNGVDSLLILAAAVEHSEPTIEVPA
jgi:hypothetical protein